MGEIIQVNKFSAVLYVDIELAFVKQCRFNKVTKVEAPRHYQLSKGSKCFWECNEYLGELYEQI